MKKIKSIQIVLLLFIIPFKFNIFWLPGESELAFAGVGTKKLTSQGTTPRLSPHVLSPIKSVTTTKTFQKINTSQRPIISFIPHAVPSQKPIPETVKSFSSSIPPPPPAPRFECDLKIHKKHMSFHFYSSERASIELLSLEEQGIKSQIERGLGRKLRKDSTTMTPLNLDEVCDFIRTHGDKGVMDFIQKEKNKETYEFNFNKQRFKIVTVPTETSTKKAIKAITLFPKEGEGVIKIPEPVKLAQNIVKNLLPNLLDNAEFQKKINTLQTVQDVRNEYIKFKSETGFKPADDEQLRLDDLKILKHYEGDNNFKLSNEKIGLKKLETIFLSSKPVNF